MVKIGNDWDELLRDEWDKSYYKNLRSFLLEEYRNETVYPPAEDIFTALRLTPYSKVKVVILGQDPYHEPGQAVGLAFSVPRGMKMPPSLVNILKELENDIGTSDAANANTEIKQNDDEIEEDMEIATVATGVRSSIENHSDVGKGGVLTPWAEQGVLLLNTVLTVRAHQAGSHRGAGWEQFTDRVIELLAARKTPMVFVLWGAQAISKKELILRAEAGSELKTDTMPHRHLIITAPHPSPLSAHRGYFGGRYFSRCNYFLEDNDIEPIDWNLAPST